MGTIKCNIGRPACALRRIRLVQFLFVSYLYAVIIMCTASRLLLCRQTQKVNENNVIIIIADVALKARRNTLLYV